MNNVLTCIDEINKHFTDRGFNTFRDLVLLSGDSTRIFLYPYVIHSRDHYNGKVFYRKDYTKNLRYLLEIIIPIMKKHNVEIDQLVMNPKDNPYGVLGDTMGQKILDLCGFKNY